MNFMSGRSGFYEDVTVTGGGSPFNVYGSAASGAAPVSSPTANGSGGEEDSDDHMLGSGRGSGGGSSSASGASYAVIEKEHMFDKVVTPSDVGKLNRLVIPKQHAEKYFPLDSSANEKGLLLNFEDRNGKPWRFRYSYWNSSQSYVMTKGWSRFVKDKKLDAGDVVSFQRGLGELGKDRLFIDWRRRPDVAELRPPPQSIPALSLLPHQFPFHRSLHPWNQPLFLHPPNSPHYRHNQFQNHYPTPTSYGGGAPHYPYNAAYLQGNPYPPSGSIVYSRSGFSIPQEATTGGIRQAEEVVFESVPVVQGKAAAKRLRLFGVNMDCPMGGESDELYDDPSMPLIQHMDSSPSINSSVDPPDCLQLMPYNENDDKGKGSVSLDLDMLFALCYLRCCCWLLAAGCDRHARRYDRHQTFGRALKGHSPHVNIDGYLYATSMVQKGYLNLLRFGGVINPKHYWQLLDVSVYKNWSILSNHFFLLYNDKVVLHRS